MRSFFARLMYGRYGGDQLSQAMLAVAFILSVISIFVSAPLLTIICYLLFFAAVFRMLSRNFQRRRAENDRYLQVAAPLYRWLRQRQNQARDTSHRYYKCPNCKRTLRVPRGKGRISITCSQCGARFEKKT